MKPNQFLLLKTDRFMPLFVTQFLGAFHDNLFKNAFIVLLLFGTAKHAGPDAKIMTTIAAGLFILPFVLFSAMGGQLADKYPKDKVMRVIKLIELGIALLGTISLITESPVISFITLFVLGTHSAFFGPSKYSILPQHLQDNELIGGNALLNTGTFLAILLGTILGTSLITTSPGVLLVSTMLFTCAIGGYIASRFIPVTPAIDPTVKISFNPFRDLKEVLVYTFNRSPMIILCVLGIGWFYFMGGTFMAQLPNFVHDTLRAGEYALTILLVLFSIGIAIGGLMNNRLLQGRIEAKYVPLAVLGITFFSLDLFFASAGMPGHLPVRVAFDVTLISVCGGLFVVPLNAMLQHFTPPDHRARIMAASAIISALFGVLSSVLSILLIAIGLDVRGIFLTFAIVNAFIALCIGKVLFRPVNQ